MKRLFQIIVASVTLLVVGLSFIGSPTIGLFNFMASGGDEGLAKAPTAHTCIWECPECGLCLDKDCQEGICQEKCQGHIKPHECESKCYVCGKCVDTACTEEVCKDKCGAGENMTAYKFEAEDSSVVLKAGSASAGATQARDLAVRDGYVGQFDGPNTGASITFIINSPKATTATLCFSICKRSDARRFDKYLRAMINGSKLNTNAVLPASGTGADAWFDFATVTLGCISLKEGKNEITFAIASTHSLAGGNVDNIVIKSTEKLTWAEHECHSVCSDCGKCKNADCQETVCAQKCACVLVGYTFEAEHDNVDLVSPSVTKRPAKGCIGGISTETGVLGDATITFNITAEKACTSNFIIYINKRKSAYAFNSVYKIIINGKEHSTAGLTVPSNGNTEGWNTYFAFNLGEINFNQGENTIVIQTLKNSSTAVGSDIDKLYFETVAPLSWTAKD